MEAKLAEALDNEWKRTEECREKERENQQLRARVNELIAELDRERLFGSRGDSDGDETRQLRREMKALEDQVDELKDKEVEWANKVAELERKQKDTEAEMERIEEKHQQEKQKRLEQEGLVQELRSKCGKLEKKISMMREENCALQDEKQIAIEGHSAVSNRLYNVQAELDNTLEELRNRRGRGSMPGGCSLEAELEGGQSGLRWGGIGGENSVAGGVMLELVGSSMKELEQLRSMVQKLQSELRATDKDAVARLKAELGVMQSWRATAETARRQVLETIAERDRRVKVAADELRRQENRVEANATTVYQLEKESNEAKLLNMQLKFALEQEKKHNEWMRAQMRRQSEELARMEDEIDTRDSRRIADDVHRAMSDRLEMTLRVAEVEAANLALTEMVARQKERLQEGEEAFHRARKLSVWASKYYQQKFLKPIYRIALQDVMVGPSIDAVRREIGAMLSSVALVLVLLYEGLGGKLSGEYVANSQSELPIKDISFPGPELRVTIETSNSYVYFADYKYAKNKLSITFDEDDLEELMEDYPKKIGKGTFGSIAVSKDERTLTIGYLDKVQGRYTKAE
ncbi:hypothetical protein FOL47_004523 [Perkinsus chesapeaki]|uniref:Uncharacterized protein n=1 Tax=Perkinsus chesapeaki TaxID=330153 RepID=A0A7J6M263_PERCH|nr:hypothetical protein FOL47_004523 [Perkinsus chesapeaki]